MSIRITEIDTPAPGESRVFKVEGALHLRDAELLDKFCRETSAHNGCPVKIELNDVCFVDSDGAALLCRLKRENVVTIEGLNLFTRRIMDLVDECGLP